MSLFVAWLHGMLRRALFLVTNGGAVMLRVGLAIFGLGVVLASPILAETESRYALIVELPWQDGRAFEIGRGAGGLLLQSGWHNAVFYFPEGVALPDWTGATVTFPVSGNIGMCSRTNLRESK